MAKSDLIAGYFSDAIENQYGDRYLCFGTADKCCCVAISDLHNIDTKLVKRLARAGTTIVATQEKEALKKAAQSVKDFRKVCVSDSPGWVPGGYALRDTNLVNLKASSDEIIVAFAPDDRFAASCDLSVWQNAVGPFVRNQPLLLYALAFSLVGSILRFAPPDVQNPVIEFVGAKETGKSTLAKLMSSVWGGDDGALLGVCDDWDFSPVKLDEMRQNCRDALLVLDEVNRASKDEHEKARIVSSAIFKLADTSSRKRYGEASNPSIRQAVVSTSNVPIKRLTAMGQEVREAMLSRILSVSCCYRYGIFDKLPADFASGKAAVQALDAASTNYCGAAAPAFLKRLSSYPEHRIRKAIAKGFRLAEQRGLLSATEGARISKTVALAFVAGKIAMELGVFPKSWGSLDEAFLDIFSEQGVERSTDRSRSAVQKIHAYIDAHRDSLISERSKRLPLPSQAFERTPGVWLESQSLLVVSTRFFQQNLSDCVGVLKQVRAEGHLHHEHGQLSKKSPRKICKGGRAYFIKVDPHIAFKSGRLKGGA